MQERDLFLQIFKPLSRNLRFLQALNALGEQLELRLEVGLHQRRRALHGALFRFLDSSHGTLLGFFELGIDQLRCPLLGLLKLGIDQMYCSLLGFLKLGIDQLCNSL